MSKPIDPGNGFHKMSREAYDSLDRVNFSTLKLFGESPAHYHHRMLTGDSEDTDARARGRCVHLAVLEPEKFKSDVVVWEGGTRRGNNWEVFKERNEGKEILKPEAYEEVLAIAKAVRASPLATKYIGPGESEVAVLWTHVVPDIAGLAGYRIQCKALIDRITAFAIVDLKNTRNASPVGFGRECANYAAHVQAAFYSDGVKAALREDFLRPYVLLAAEAKAPHVVQPYFVPDALIEAGRETYRSWLDRLNLCRSENEWPGYATGDLELMLPRWALPQEQDDVSDLDLVIG